MNDFLQDDFFYAKPNLSTESLNKDSLIESILQIEEFHGTDLFLENPVASDFVLIEGNTTSVLDADNTSYNVLASADVDLQMVGGSHNIIQLSGSLDLDQSSGEAIVYLTDLENVTLNIEITGGILEILIDDPNTLGKISISDGVVFTGENRLGIDFSNVDLDSTSVLITNLTDGNSLQVSSNSDKAALSAVGDSGYDATGVDGSNNFGGETDLTTNSDGDFDSFDEFLEQFYGSENTPLEQIDSLGDVIDFNSYEQYMSLSSGSLDIDTFSDFEASHYFYQDIQVLFSENANPNEDTTSAIFTESSSGKNADISIDDVIEIAEYSDFIWESGVEIYGD